VELAFGWTAFGEVGTAPLVAPPVMIEEAAPPEAPEEVEAPPVFEAPAVEEWPPLEEVPAPEVAPPTEEIRWGAALAVTLEEEVAPAPVIEEVPGVSEMEITEPLEEAAPPPEVPAVEVPTVSLVAERAYLKEHPRDYETWLALAQALWQADEREEALEAYTRVIRAGKFLESVIPDLEEHTEQWPHASTQRVLGDAYMRAGRLQEALDTYRRALETL